MTRPQRKAAVKRRPWTRRDVQRHSTTPVQLEALLMAMPSLPRTTLERAVERMIDRLDVIDGDADHEPDGDELDGGNAEDEALTADVQFGHGPGCSISDPDWDRDADEMDHPVYGEDQTLEPLNGRTAYRDWRYRNMEGMPHPKPYSKRVWPPLRLV